MLLAVLVDECFFESSVVPFPVRIAREGIFPVFPPIYLFFRFAPAEPVPSSCPAYPDRSKT